MEHNNNLNDITNHSFITHIYLRQEPVAALPSCRRPCSNYNGCLPPTPGPVMPSCLPSFNSRPTQPAPFNTTHDPVVAKAQQAREALKMLYFYSMLRQGGSWTWFLTTTRSHNNGSVENIWLKNWNVQRACAAQSGVSSLSTSCQTWCLRVALAGPDQWPASWPFDMMLWWQPSNAEAYCVCGMKIANQWCFVSGIREQLLFFTQAFALEMDYRH